jgi:predicted acylesterase/phospholipase RssA
MITQNGGVIQSNEAGILLNYPMTSAPSVIFQASKLGDKQCILDEMHRAQALLDSGKPVGRIYGVSGGALTAMAFGLALAAKQSPEKWGKAADAVADLRNFLKKARSSEIRCLNLEPLHGPFNLNPLRRRLNALLKRYTGRTGWRISDFGVALYICTIDRDAVFTVFGPPENSLQCDYQFVHVGPPQDAPLVDAVISAVSTLLSTSPSTVNGKWVYDCRPVIVDAGAMVADLEATDPRPLLRTRPYAVIRPWKLNFITSSFIMHSQHERNQALLADYYLDLLRRHRELLVTMKDKLQGVKVDALDAPGAPTIGQVDLPYVGSTEAATNMRQSVENRETLMSHFRKVLSGQLDDFPFGRPANVIYGAGGFSGILGGLVTTRAVDDGFKQTGGEIKQIFGVSAGVLNGFFHAVQVASGRHPDVYKPAAQHALEDLENFIAHLETDRLLKMNYNPVHFWHGWANLGPLEEFLAERLTAYTGIENPQSVTFDDILLPLTVTAARPDGFTDFMGMTSLDRRFEFGGRVWKVLAAPIIKAVVAGWSMNTYVEPAELNGVVYRDGGGTFYDPSMLVACLDPELTNLITIHLNHPEGGSFNLPDRPGVVRLILDTHNYTFPEEHRRMRVLSTLLYNHFRLRKYATEKGIPVGPDFRREWKRQDTGYIADKP